MDLYLAAGVEEVQGPQVVCQSMGVEEAGSLQVGLLYLEALGAGQGTRAPVKVEEGGQELNWEV